MMAWLLSVWAALGIVATSATQLRIAGPVGAGELLLAGWMSFVGFLILRGVSFATGRIFLLMLGYWMISTILMGFGTIVALSTHKLDTANALHDAVAFAFLAALCPMLSLILFDHDGNAYHERLARHTLAIFIVCLGSLLLLASFLWSLGPVHLWYGGGARFVGWAENPNQIALFALGMPFVGWFLLTRSRRTLPRIMYGIGIACCLLVGLETASDGLRLSWIVGFGGAAALAWWRAVLRMRGRFVYVTHFLVPFLAIFAVIALGHEVFTGAWEIGQGVYEQSGQGEDRIVLWTHGLQALAQSPLVGFGPGAHSGHYGPFEAFEAHNALIDWGTSTGVPGILLHVMLVIWCARQAWRAGSLIMVGMVISLTVFAIFGYVMRQPIYWVLLILAVRLPQQQTRAKLYVDKQIDLDKMRSRRHGRVPQPMTVENAKGWH